MSASKKMLVEKPNLMWLALTAILVDLEVQSRVAMDMEHCRFLSGELAISGELKPILVFFDGDKYWLANGFHRYHVYKKAGRSQIRCIVRPGGKAEAIVESARNNDGASKEKKSEDRKKSIRMLLQIPEWRNKTAKEIGDYVGLSKTTAARFIDNLYELDGVRVSEFVTDRRGAVRPRKHAAMNEHRRIYESKEGCFYASILGKSVYLGSDRQQAEDKLRDLEKDTRKKLKSIDQVNSIASLMSSRGVLSVACDFNRQQGISVRIAKNAIFASCDISQSDRFILAVGSVLLARQQHIIANRAVVICYAEDGDPDLLNLARQLGIEFMAPEEFVASVKTDDDGAGSAVLA